MVSEGVYGLQVTVSARGGCAFGVNSGECRKFPIPNSQYPMKFLKSNVQLRKRGSLGHSIIEHFIACLPVGREIGNWELRIDH